MSCRCLALAVAGLLASASNGFTQPPREPLPLAVVDVRAASVGLPTTAGWTPPVPDGTVVPSRSYGLDLGAHVHALRGRQVALGVGAALVIARGKTSPPATESGVTPSTAPAVTTRLRTFAPQLSINFGHRAGWSYLSAGVGRARVTSDVSRALTTSSLSRIEIGAQSINYGGGARWFINEHVAVSLDLRWHRLPSVAATAAQPATARTSLIVAGGGISLK